MIDCMCKLKPISVHFYMALQTYTILYIENLTVTIYGGSCTDLSASGEGEGTLVHLLRKQEMHLYEIYPHISNFLLIV